MDDSVKRPGRTRGAWRRGVWGGLALVIVLAAVLAAAMGDGRGRMEQVLRGVEELGVWGPAIFVGVYVVATVCLVPGSVLTLGAGAAFGVVRGCLYVSLASTLGATAAFLVGRYLARDRVARTMEGRPAFRAIDRAVADEGWRVVGLTRLSPVFPFTLLNYAFGLTRVRLKEYVLASWIGMMPGTVLYVYLGSLARDGLVERERTPGEWALYGVGLVATLVVTWRVTRLARQALAQRTGGGA
ncbi:MAG: TVP38/TMEM64 family protein [Verrucomicrobiae bacterium]|nr:TVP38/TMEM64 family protein [Verrucomicrobiae bacterium]